MSHLVLVPCVVAVLLSAALLLLRRAERGAWEGGTVTAPGGSSLAALLRTFFDVPGRSREAWLALLAVAPGLLACCLLPLWPATADRSAPPPAGVESGVVLLLALLGLRCLHPLAAAGPARSGRELRAPVAAALRRARGLIVLGVVALSILLPTASLDLAAVVRAQETSWLGGLPAWNLWLQPIGFLAFVGATLLFSGSAGGELTPALPLTDESSLPQRTVAERIDLALLSGLGATLFMGGWSFPGLALAGGGGALLAVAVLAAKSALLLLLFHFLAGLAPRPRPRRDGSWKLLLPASGLQLVITAARVMRGSLP